MAYNPKPLLALLLVFNILLAAVATGREIPTDSKTVDKKKQPEMFIGKDGSVLVPGIGRFMLPRPGHGFNPFTYNPVTGSSGGAPVGVGSGTGDDSGGASHSYVPGGDDTLVPNPGVEVPNPGSGIGTGTGTGTGTPPAVAAARP